MDREALAAAGLIAATAFAGAFAVFLIVSERRRHETAEDELAAQASFLESLVESIAAVSGTLDPEEIVERACDEAKRLFDARSARFVPPGEETTETEGKLVVTLAVRGEPLGVDRGNTLGCIRALGPHTGRRARRLRLARGRERPTRRGKPMSARPSAPA